jgi:hypothetical protein
MAEWEGGEASATTTGCYMKGSSAMIPPAFEAMGRDYL